LWGANGTNNTLQTFDPATGAILSGITVPAAGSLVYVAKDGVTLLAPNNKTITVLSGITGKLTATVTLPDFASEVVFSPDGSTAYVAGSHSIMVLSLTSFTVTGQHQVSGSVGALAASPDGTKVYAAVKGAKPTETGRCAGGKYFTGLCAFDTTSFKVLAQTPLLYGQVMVSQDGKTVYSIPEKAPTLYALDPATLKITATLIGGFGSTLPFSMNMAPTGNSAVVFLAGTNPAHLTVDAMLLNTQTNQLTSLYFFSFNFPTLFGNLNPLVPSAASFSRDGTSFWMLSATGTGANPTLLGVQVPGGAVIANSTIPLATSEVTF
jgi:DNA-binding beta-propeller fold protein YncE